VASAVSLGAVTQMRQLGGVIGLAVTQAILNGDFRSQLTKFLSTEELKAVMLSTENIKKLSAAHKDLTCRAYGGSANMQMRVVTAFAGAAILTSIFAWQRAPKDRKALEAERVALQTGHSSQVELYSTSGSLRSRSANTTLDSSRPSQVQQRSSSETPVCSPGSSSPPYLTIPELDGGLSWALHFSDW
jgi:hypothetical protein